MTDFKIYANEDFCLISTAYEVYDPANASKNVKADISGYDFIARLQTAPNSFIMADTIGENEIAIERPDDNTLKINISHELTQKLYSGVFVLTIMMIDKQSGNQSIAERKTIEVVKSNLSDYAVG